MDNVVIGHDQSNPVERAGITDDGGFVYVDRDYIDAHPDWYEPAGIVHINNERVSMYRLKAHKGPS